MPQTRFVLMHALEHGLQPLVIVNKIDRPGARPHEVLDGIFDLMVELGADDEQLDFPVVYTSAVVGSARNDADAVNMDLTPPPHAINHHVPGPARSA